MFPDVAVVDEQWDEVNVERSEEKDRGAERVNISRMQRPSWRQEEPLLLHDASADPEKHGWRMDHQDLAMGTLHLVDGGGCKQTSSAPVDATLRCIPA